MSVWIFSSRPIQLQVFLYWKHIEGIKLMTKYHFWMAIDSRFLCRLWRNAHVPRAPNLLLKIFPPLDVARSRSESGELSRNGYLPSTMSSENGKWPSWINSDGFEYQKCAGITFSHSFWVFTWILWLWYRLRAETQRGELMSANYDWWYEPRCASWLHVISNHMSIFIRLRSPQLAPLLLLGNLLLKTPTGVCLSVCHLTNVTLWIIMWK